MGMPAALEQYYTREMVLAFPDDGNRYELVYGELLVSPSPVTPHQRVVGRVYHALANYIEANPVGEVLLSPADISWGRPYDVLVQPDVFVVGHPDAGTDDWSAMRTFHLFIEVLSPSTARYDRFTKRRLYQDMKVPLYWVIDVAHQRAEIWTPEATAPVMESNRLEWGLPGSAEPFALELKTLFVPLRV
jgi:Uma2 family endonuclease